MVSVGYEPYQFVQILQVNVSVLISKVAAHSQDYVVGSVIFSLLVYEREVFIKLKFGMLSGSRNLLKRSYPFIDIVVRTMFSVNDWFISAKNIEAEAWRWLVLIVECSSEQICAFTWKFECICHCLGLFQD